MPSFLVAALYHFASLPDPAALREPLLSLCQRHGVKGTLLLAHEGINGTIAGPEPGLRAVLDHLRALPGLGGLEHKESRTARMPFYRMKVKLKREIVTLGVPGLDPAAMAGRYVDAQAWNALIAEPDVVTVDVRNDYEVAIGSFTGAVNPRTTTFSAFPQWVQEQSRPGGALAGKPRVAMFCTGGIRCEKSTAYLRTQGFDEVYHLRGGILKYLETVPQEQSRWQGECFVFDERVAVGHGLAQGSHRLCRACRWPVSDSDRASALYEEGICCPHCHDTLTAQRRARLAERQRQIALAHARGQMHVGQSYPVLYSFRRCPFAMRARLALLAAGQVCELREVSLRDKPEALLRASPKATVPVLLTRAGRVIDESLDIMLWALQRHDPQGLLQPQEGNLSEMLMLVQQNDTFFKARLDRYKYPGRFGLHAGTGDRDVAARWLRAIDERLRERPWLYGDRPALADLALAPFVRQFARVDEAWFTAQDWPALQAWLARIVQGPAFAQVMHKAAVWVPGAAPVLFPLAASEPA